MAILIILSISVSLRRAACIYLRRQETGIILLSRLKGVRGRVSGMVSMMSSL